MGLQGDKGRETKCGWDFIFSGDEELQLVVEGNTFFMVRAVYFHSGQGWVLKIYLSEGVK